MVGNQDARRTRFGGLAHGRRGTELHGGARAAEGTPAAGEGRGGHAGEGLAREEARQEIGGGLRWRGGAGVV